jgi:hypothetical protein
MNYEWFALAMRQHTAPGASRSCTLYPLPCTASRSEASHSFIFSKAE